MYAWHDLFSLSDMRTVRPQGRTFRITQPYGLRPSYLAMHPRRCNRSNQIVIGNSVVINEAQYSKYVHLACIKSWRVM